MRSWYLEGYVGGGKALRRYQLYTLPFRLGRQAGLPLTLEGQGISREHAELVQDDDGNLMVRDLGSTNGTFVNRKRVDGTMAVADGDILHFADHEFRLVEQKFDSRSDLNSTRAGISTLSEQLPQGAREFQQLLLQSKVTTVFQPIVKPDGAPFAYEMLGRGTHPELPESPGPLFRIADSLDLEVHFSELLRIKGLEAAKEADDSQLYFFNIHPHEVHDQERLVHTLRRARDAHPDLNLVLEIHEGAVTHKDAMLALRAELESLNMQLAYDDFGAGQARLVELAEVPPEFIKLDMALIRDLDEAPDAKRDMVAMLTEYAQKLEIQVIAEGVSSQGEARVCREIGCDLYQGFLFGRPSADLQ